MGCLIWPLTLWLDQPKPWWKEEKNCPYAGSWRRLLACSCGVYVYLEPRKIINLMLASIYAPNERYRRGNWIFLQTTWFSDTIFCLNCAVIRYENHGWSRMAPLMCSPLSPDALICMSYLCAGAVTSEEEAYHVTVHSDERSTHPARWHRWLGLVRPFASASIPTTPIPTRLNFTGWR